MILVRPLCLFVLTAGLLARAQDPGRPCGITREAAPPNLDADLDVQRTELERLLKQPPVVPGRVRHAELRTPHAGDDPARVILRRTGALLAALGASAPGDAAAELRRLERLEAPPEERLRRAAALRRRVAFSNPLLDFKSILFAKRAPGRYSHMSDQYFGWWSRPGGGLYLLEAWKEETPQLTCLTPGFPPGSFLRPELSPDARSILFAYARHFPGVAELRNKVDKEALPEEAFYHLYEMSIDGTGVHQLTRGRYDDFDGRYLPDGGIAFLSTRRGSTVQCTSSSAAGTLLRGSLPDSFVRCGGGDYRPVAVYTLHRLDPERGTLRPLSSFENFEWTPSVAADGRLLYSRWDYIDRDNMPFMSLWTMRPDGSNSRLVYGNHTRNPHAIFETRSVPGSTKLMFTASAHHSITGGSICLLDPDLGSEDLGPLERLTPEVCFPESEGWPATWYSGPHPLSEDVFLASWSHKPLRREGQVNEAEGQGLYLCDAFGNRELLHRDPALSCMDPVPVRPRPQPPVLSSTLNWDGPQEGRFLIQNVAQGLGDKVSPGSIRSLRVVAVPIKVQPQMDSPKLGLTRDDPGKAILGTVPVEADGSAYFRAPSGIPLFFQALDEEGTAVQTMRSVTSVQPGELLSCVGCHEPRHSTPANRRPLAAAREPSRIRTGPAGSWPLRFDRLVQPVLDRHCVSCHKPGRPGAGKDLTPERAYETLVSHGKPSLRDHVLEGYREGRSHAGEGAARTSPLWALLRAGHQGVRLEEDDRSRLLTWMDTYAQRLGSYGPDQERELEQLRKALRDLLEE